MRTGTTARRAFLPTVAALIAAVGPAGCGVSPEDAEAGQLTGVVTSRSDSFSLPRGGATDIYDRVVVVTEDQLLAAYEGTWPGRRMPEPYEYGYLGLTFPESDLARLTASGDVHEGAAVAAVTGGRLRIAWADQSRFLCFGTAYQGHVRTTGCALVAEDPPAEVMFQVSIGGISVKD